MESTAALAPILGMSADLALHVVDPEVVAELLRRADGDERGRYALSALRVGVRVRVISAGRGSMAT